MITESRKFWFNQKNGNGSLVIFSLSYEEALKELEKMVKDINNWECENEEGEEV